MGNYDVLDTILKGTCGENNELIYDDVGMPSVMVKIPKFDLSYLWPGREGPFPAFLSDTNPYATADEIYVSKFMNVIENDRAYSLPGQDYANSITPDEAALACAKKGKRPGQTFDLIPWHMMTRLEWMALAFLADKNGTLPNGNNYFGKDKKENSYRAIPMTRDAQNRVNHIAGGSGPITWSHDHTPAGVWDLKGNGWETMFGIRFVFGELQVLSVLPDNEEDPIVLNNSAMNLGGLPWSYSGQYSNISWCAIDGTTGNLIPITAEDGKTPNCLRLDYQSGHLKWIKGTLQNKSMTTRSALIKNVGHDSLSSDALDVLLYLGLWGTFGGKLSIKNGLPVAVLSCGGMFGTMNDDDIYSVDATVAPTAKDSNTSFRSSYVYIV